MLKLWEEFLTNLFQWYTESGIYKYMPMSEKKVLFIPQNKFGCKPWEDWKIKDNEYICGENFDYENIDCKG